MNINYLLIILLSILLIFYIYYFIARSIEPFEIVSTRPCTVWFTEHKQECDEGLFHKDLRSIEYIRNESASTVDKQIISTRKRLQDNEFIITNYKNMTVLAIERKIVADAEKYINEEKAKGLNRNQMQIGFEERKIQNSKSLARQYFYSIPTLERENIRLRNSLISLNTQASRIRSSPEFKKISNVLETKRKDPNFRCKNEYLGWDELNSRANPELNDFTKSTVTESQNRGHPYTWAFCHKKNNNIADKSKIDSHLLNKKYQAISLYEDTTTDPLTSSIRFNKFDQNDMMECDDAVITRNLPSIPNGLLEIKIAPNNYVTSMKVVRYKNNDSRIIDNQSSLNLSDIDLTRLMTLFYDFIINLERDTYQFYVYPKTSLTYRVYNLYYDNKCKRFFGDSKKPLGISKAGDLFNKTYPFILIDKTYTRDAIRRQNIPFPSREYINPNSVNSRLLSTILNNMNTSLQNNTNVLNTDRRLLNEATNIKRAHEGARNWYRAHHPFIWVRCDNRTC